MRLPAKILGDRLCTSSGTEVGECVSPGAHNEMDSVCHLQGDDTTWLFTLVTLVLGQGVCVFLGTAMTLRKMT